MSKSNVAIYIDNRCHIHFLEIYSIKNQIEKCKEYAEKQNYNIVETYIDNFKESTTKTAFYKMIEDSKSNRFDKVIIFSYKIFGFGIREYILKHSKMLIETVDKDYGEFFERLNR